jgi:hypothetical protein
MQTRVVPVLLTESSLFDRFNQGGQDETSIVTSTGQFVIAWDLAKAKKGLVGKYEIKKCLYFSRALNGFLLPCFDNRYEDRVVQDNFKFGDDKQIVRYFFSVVAHADNLAIPDRCITERRPCCRQKETQETNSKFFGNSQSTPE